MIQACRSLVVPLALLLTATSASPGGAVASEIEFREVSEAWGLGFRHHHGGSGRRYMVETMVGGVVLFDYDFDGDEDVFFVDGGPLPGYVGEEARSRLYRNDRGGRFVDVTDSSAIEVTAYGSGATAGDYDGDGAVDLYVTALGANQLLRNRGDGTFVDTTSEAGVGDPLWGVSAAFGDPDNDGDLDLYLSNYVDFSIGNHSPCHEGGLEIYCYPDAYAGQPDRFYRNLGNARFEEVAAAVGLTSPEPMAGMGVVFGDLDNDGWTDLYVANDADPNFLFRNRGDGTFEEVGLAAGAALNRRGTPESGMGTDIGDLNGDGLQEIAVTNFERQSVALYFNRGGFLFRDVRVESSLRNLTYFQLGFGLDFSDLDHDGDLDLVLANGHIHDNIREFPDEIRYRRSPSGGAFAQPNQVLLNNGRGEFAELPGSFTLARVSRGLATGDLDGDGDLDLVFANNDDRAEVYENLGAAVPDSWLQVDLAGSASHRHGIGARLELVSGRRAQLRDVRTASSYLSQNALTTHFGLAGATAVDHLFALWPSGQRQRFSGVPTNRRLRLFE